MNWPFISFGSENANNHLMVSLELVFLFLAIFFLACYTHDGKITATKRTHAQTIRIEISRVRRNSTQKKKK